MSVINSAVIAPTDRSSWKKDAGRRWFQNLRRMRGSACAENREEGVNPALNPHDLSLLNCLLKVPFSDRIQFNKVNACRSILIGDWFWSQVRDVRTDQRLAMHFLSGSGCKRQRFCHQNHSPGMSPVTAATSL